MDAVTMIKERRSIRKFKDQKVDRKLLNEIFATTIYAPSWANSQTVRYTVIDDREMINKLVREGFQEYTHNQKILSGAAGAVVVSNVKGISGCAPGSKGNYITPKGSGWEMFDAGIACQTFCLAAFEKGIGTVIMGIFNEEKIAELINLPEAETISAVIAYGYAVEHPKAPKRKAIEEVVRYL